MKLPSIIFVGFLLTVPIFSQSKIFEIGIHRTGGIPINNSEIQKIINDLKDLGSNWIRIDLSVDDVLEYNLSNDFTLLDNYLNQLHKANLSILINLRGFFKEHRYSIVKGYVNDLNLKTFIQRYSFIKNWQLENEIMSKKFWKGTLNDYVELLKSFYSIVKSTDGEQKVILAGISSNFLSANLSSSETSKFKFTLKDFILKNNNHFDIVDVHLYHNPKDIPQKITIVRELVNKPIIATEIGGPDSRVVNISNFTSDQYYNDMYLRLMHCYDNNVQLVFWHNLNGPSQDANAPWSHMSLKNNGKPNNNYCNLKFMIRNKEKLFSDD